MVVLGIGTKTVEKVLAREFCVFVVTFSWAKPSQMTRVWLAAPLSPAAVLPPFSSLWAMADDIAVAATNAVTANSF
jgi:hypothetical protein